MPTRFAQLIFLVLAAAVVAAAVGVVVSGRAPSGRDADQSERRGATTSEDVDPEMLVGGNAASRPATARSRAAAKLHHSAQRALAEVQQLPASAPVDLELGRRFSDGASISAAGTTVVATPVRARPVARHNGGRGAVTYVDAWANVDVVQEPSEFWMKESLVLRLGSLGADLRGAFAFDLRGRAVPKLDATGGVTFRDGGATLALRIPAPRAVDAAGKLLPRKATTFALDGRRLTIHVALPTGTPFPVTVDPTFTMGQGADHVIGQSGFDNAAPRHGRDNYGLYRPLALASDGTNLMVADYANGDKISIFDTFPTTNATPQDSGWSGGLYAGGMWTNGTRTLLSDQSTNRVLVYDAFDGTVSRVLGQTSSTGFQANDGGRSARTMNNPFGVWSDGTRIVVADEGNHRVLIWNSWPSADGEPADIVLGQANMTAGAGNRGGSVGADTLLNPRGVYFDGARLYVADMDNHRVLVWNSFPSSSGQPADRVLGQSALNRRVCNDAVLPSKARMCAPVSVKGDGTRMAVVDGTHRVLLWNSPPTATQQPADVFVGDGTAGHPTSTSTHSPSDVIIVNGKLAVAEYYNRVTLWDTFPTSDSQPADHVLGQTDFTHNGAMGNRGDSWYDIVPIEYDLAGRLWVGTIHDAILMRFPATLPAIGAVADYSPETSTPGNAPEEWDPSRYTVWNPQDIRVAEDGTFLVTQTDSGSRVTWSGSAPSANPPQPWDAAVGQPTPTTLWGQNQSGAPAANTLNAPMGSDWDGTHFAVADTQNHRVLIWQNKPTTNEPADIVLGQPNFTTTSPNTGGVSANSLSSPRSVRLYRGKLYVADTGNNRVLIWNSIPSADHAAADVVLGQPSMFSSGAVASASGLHAPLEVDANDGMLAIADGHNRRVLLWDEVPAANGEAADRVIGKPDMTSNGCSRLRAGLCYPMSIALRHGKLAVQDEQRRILVYDDVQAPAVSGVAAVVAGERATVSWTTDEEASSELVWDTSPHALANEYAFSSSPAGRRRAHVVSAEPLTSGLTYYYRVVSVDARGNSTVSSEGTFTAANVTRLQAASGFASDATIDEAQLGRNYGGSAEMVIGGGSGARTRSLVRFDVDQLPSNATILSATLRLHQTDAGSASMPTVRARTVLGAWEEGGGDGTVEPAGVTWASTDGVDPWMAPGADVGPVVATNSLPSAIGAFQMDLTTQVADWVSGVTANAGVALQLDPEASGETRRFASSEHTDPTLRPVLEIEWSGRDVAQPRVANVRTQAISSSSVRVKWDTDEPTTSVLEYGTTIAYGAQLADPVATNSHELVLDDLQPSTTYHVRVTATDAQGNFTRSSDVVFRTSYRVRIVATDAALREDKPNLGSGAHGVLTTGNMSGTWLRARSVLKFDMSVLPPAARIRAASASMVLARQASATSPQLHVSPLAQDFVEGTRNPRVSPIASSAGLSDVAPEPLHSSAERHMVLTPSGWWQFTPNPNQWESTIMRHRRSADGFGFSSDATFGLRARGKNGIALADDGAVVWSAAFVDGTSDLDVAQYTSGSDAVIDRRSAALPTGVEFLPSIVVASDGYLWVKGESNTGEIWVARSVAPRDPSAWQAPVQVASQSVPAHATLVPLGGGRVLLVSQDGGQLSSREWNGASWDGPVVAASGAQVPSPWFTRTSFAVVDDGAGGAWLTFVVAGGGVQATRYAGGVWSMPGALSATGTAVAISRDRNGDVPVAFWQEGTALRTSRFSGSWSMPSLLPVTLPAITTQLAATPPSDDALGITWTVAYGTGFEIMWYGLALDRPADGATWNSTDGSAPWASPGGNAGAPAIATPAAPAAVGGVMNFDLTDAATDWYDGTTPNHGLLLRAATENPAWNEWKAFYSSEAVNPSVRPVLTVDYDLATTTVTKPTSATVWRSSSRQELTWQVSGSGATQAEIRYSSDGGATWPNVVTGTTPDTGSYEWTTPAAEGSYRVQVTAKSALGDVIAIGESDPFVIDDTPPDPVTDLAAPSPSSTTQLTWSVPADNVGGGGMGGATYRVYRSTSSGALGSRIATVPTAFYTDASPLADGTYHYTVLPVDTAGNAQLVGNDQIAVVHDASQPNAVTDLLGPSLTNSAVPLTWSAVTDVGLAGMGTYRLYRSAAAGVLGTLVGTFAPPGTSTTPPSDGTWYYTVLPIDLAGNQRAAGNNQIAVTYDTLAPTGGSVVLDGGAALTSTGNVTASLAATGAVDYQVSLDPGFAGASWTAMAVSAPVVLAGDGSHSVYARYRDAAGNVSASVSDAIILDTTAPTPDPMTGTGAGASPTSITWTASVASDANGLHATAYSVDSGTPSWQSSRSVVEGGLSANTQYTRTVRARDAAGNVRTGTAIARTLPNAPTGATAAPRNWTSSGYRILLSWTAPVGGANSYNVRSSADGYASIVLNTSSTTQTVTGLAMETTYTYRICAVNVDGGEESACAGPVSATTALRPPVSATSTNVTATSADFDWPDVAGATGYQVYLFADAACTVAGGATGTVPGSAWNATGLDVDRYYAYHVRTINADGVAGGPTTCYELSSSNKRTAISVTLDASAQDLGSGLPGDTLTGSSTVTAQTFGSVGYAVHASVDAQPSTGGVPIPPTTSGTVAAPGPWAGDGFGFSVASATNLDPKWAAGTNFAPFSTSPTAIHATGAALTSGMSNTTSTTIGYRMDIPPTQLAGAFATTITYAVVPSV